MSEQKKKRIPKFQKKLRGFLSDESGKITKEDVLKMGLLAMGVANMNTVSADYCDHSNSCDIYGSSSASIIGSSTPTVGTIRSAAKGGIVNGHLNYLEGVVGIVGLPGHTNTQAAQHSNGQYASHGNYVSHTNSGSGSGSGGGGGWC